ncbi:MAG TPA: hypothetical protein VE225_00060 [Rubrobacteraceae bacterium]|nr:hypothetical protein [Rubrobacteraceae bacterium]
MDERATQVQQGSSPLRSKRGVTAISDAVVSRVIGIAAPEVEGIQMGGTARAVGGSWTA